MFSELKPAVDPERHRRWSWVQGVVGWPRALTPTPCLGTTLPEWEKQRPWLLQHVSDQGREGADLGSFLPSESLCASTVFSPVHSCHCCGTTLVTFSP